jgi:hypothetical protein
VKIAHEKLREGETASRNEARWPNGDHAAPAYLGCNQPEWNDDRKERQLPSNHRAELHEVEIGDARERDQRRAESAKRNRRGIANEREFGGFERSKAQSDEQCSGDGNRGTESCRTFNKRAEAKCD